LANRPCSSRSLPARAAAGNLPCGPKFGRHIPHVIKSMSGKTFQLVGKSRYLLTQRLDAIFDLARTIFEVIDEFCSSHLYLGANPLGRRPDLLRGRLRCVAKTVVAIGHSIVSSVVRAFSTRWRRSRSMPR
jgi:hypothetical protein